MGIRCADHVTPLYPLKLAPTSPTGGGRSVGIVRSRTKATGFSFLATSVKHITPCQLPTKNEKRWRAQVLCDVTMGILVNDPARLTSTLVPLSADSSSPRRLETLNLHQHCYEKLKSRHQKISPLPSPQYNIQNFIMPTYLGMRCFQLSLRYSFFA